MVLENFDTDSAQLADVLGWTRLVHIEPRNTRRAHDAANPFNAEQMRRLAAVNHLDAELLCHARKLASIRTAAAKARGASNAAEEYEAFIKGGAATADAVRPRGDERGRSGQTLYPPRDDDNVPFDAQPAGPARLLL
jgi:hypothetical protein